MLFVNNSLGSDLRLQTQQLCVVFSIYILALQVRGTDYKTSDGTCIRDYIDVTDLVDAHVKALEKATPSKVGIYNVGTGKGKPLFLGCSLLKDTLVFSFTC